MLPFADGAFSSAIAILMLHHMRSKELQDRAFREIFRVLRPGGVFLGFEIPDGWWHRIVHTKSTFVPIKPEGAEERLSAAGFSQVRVSSGSGGFRIRAMREPRS
jgi:SAM-dependent methyltransferase